MGPCLVGSGVYARRTLLLLGLLNVLFHAEARVVQEGESVQLLRCCPNRRKQQQQQQQQRQQRRQQAAVSAESSYELRVTSYELRVTSYETPPRPPAL